MNLLKYDFRILSAIVFMGLIFSPSARADNGFWISKGTATSTPSRKIQKTTITPIAKPPAEEKPAVTEPVVAEAKRSAMEKLPAGPDPVMAATDQAEKQIPSAEEASVQPLTQPTAETSEPSSTDGPYVGVTFSNPVQQKWRVGVVLVTGSNPAKEVFTYIPIPKEWPEQDGDYF